jgi:uncharacterized protein
VAEIRHPGVFVTDTSSGTHPISVPTSIAAFVGRAWCGPVDAPVNVFSYGDHERIFGGLWRESPASYAVRQFFENGGTQAVFVRVATRSGAAAAQAATIRLAGGEVFRAGNPGTWGLNLNVTVDHKALADPKDATLFNLTVTDDAASRRDAEKRGGSGAVERFANVSVDPKSPQYIGSVLDAQSQLLRLASGLRAFAPSDQANVTASAGSASDGAPIGTAEVTDPANRAAGTGLFALDKVDLFNLLCIPPYRWTQDNDIAQDWKVAAQYCGERRAFLIIDAPMNWTVETAEQGVTAFGAIEGENAALYFPRVTVADPLRAGAPMACAPCGMVAGVYARTDGQRGVWQAPAGTGAMLATATGISLPLTDADNGRLNPLAINCLRTFPGLGGVMVWGARTLAGSNRVASEWKYVPVRRLALCIEESVYRGTQWVVFEPNSEPTWTQVVRTTNAFLTGLWQQGALSGSRPEEAFFVRCDRTTMTEDDIRNGNLVAEIGIAPIRPAEFVILRFYQKTAEARV